MLSRSAGSGSLNGQDGLNYWHCLLIPPLIMIRLPAPAAGSCSPAKCCAWCGAQGMSEADALVKKVSF